MLFLMVNLYKYYLVLCQNLWGFFLNPAVYDTDYFTIEKEVLYIESISSSSVVKLVTIGTKDCTSLVIS